MDISDRPAVLVVFANVKGNLGDFAILHAMLEELVKRFPGRRIDVCSHGQHRADDKRFAAFVALANPAFHYVGRTPFLRIPRAWSFFKRIGLSSAVSERFIRRLANEYGKKSPFEEVETYDAVVFAGGEQWSGFSNGITMLAVLSMLIPRNPNLYLFPCSVKEKLVEMHRMSRLEHCFGAFSGRVITRDSRSHGTVRKFRSDAISGVDCVFSLGDCVDVPDRVDGTGKEVLFALTTSPGSRNNEVRAAFQRLEAQGFRVRMLSSCEREDGDDHRVICGGDESKCLFPETWQEAVGLLGRADVVFTNRLHCLIFSFFTEVAVVPVLDREKLLGVFRDADLPLGIKSVDEIDAALIGKILERKDEIRERISAYREQMEPDRMFPMPVSGLRKEI